MVILGFKYTGLNQKAFQPANFLYYPRCILELNRCVKHKDSLYEEYENDMAKDL